MCILVLLLLLVRSVSSRKWTDIQTHHRPDPFDITIFDFLLENDPFRFTSSPSETPTLDPTREPSSAPTKSLTPTSSPTTSHNPSTSPSTYFPSSAPSEMPSKVPTQEPSITPTVSPTSSPSEERFPENDPLPSDYYFNYNTKSNAKWGPGYPELIPHNATTMKIHYRNNAWATRTPPENWYWDEFDSNGFGPWVDILTNKNPRKNRCGRIGRQSPIDVRDSGAKCEEHHQIRTRRGDFTLRQGITAQILPNKLRLLFERRPCADVDLPECSEPDPPHADFPHNWGGYTDVMHVDFKFPSEHLLYGERFDGEMQIVHLHPTRRRAPIVVSLMKAKRGGFNPLLQNIIDEFQYVFNDHASQCATRRQRRTTTDSLVNVTARNLHRIFTPHHKLLVPSVHFFGYEGSLTEPPCSELVSWFITDTPMTMSFEQLEQLKRIQFRHVDPHCRKTSVHYEDSNARPIQDTFGRPVWRCTTQDFQRDPLNMGR
mmetsp:Transcript_18576/g.27553  ORF Transcript_18576/g.27553 Transcript_18576/m.27553 type:complete len:486 (+) Transcript_18576:170-1627(+)